MESGIIYHRLSPTLENVVELGETNRDKLIRLVIEANQSEQTKLQIDQLLLDLSR